MHSDTDSDTHRDIIVISRHTVPVRDESDVYAAVGLGRKMTTDMGFAPAAQACAQTIIAELARNALRHGGGGTVELCALKAPLKGESHSLEGQETRQAIEIVVQDRGPGIPDLSRALGGLPPPPRTTVVASEGTGYSGGLGVGLSSAQRLADEFTIDTVVGSGTRIRARKWDSPHSARRNK